MLTKNNYGLYLLIIFFVSIYPLRAINQTPPKDTLSNNSLMIIDDTSEDIYIPESEFMYANTPRVTMDGSRPLKETDIKPVPALIVGGAYSVIFYLQHIGQVQTIWDEMGPFHFQEDGQYALWADKAGHFFGTYYASYILSEALLTAGFSWDAATNLGGVLGFCYDAYVEVLDGFAVNWGFSPSDFYADIAGASFFIAQHYVPVLQNFTPKFTYVPAPWHGDNHRIPSDMFIDDYSSHTLWLSANVHNLLPDDYKKYWPEWLELSVGYAVRNLCDPTKPSEYTCDPTKGKLYKTYDGWEVRGSKRYVIALDYNLAKIIPDSWNFLNWVRQSVNYIKFPAPAIEFGDETNFYLFYPFKLDFTFNL